MKRFGLPAALVGALCVGCGGDAATSPMPMAPTSVGAYQGTWTGQTSQSERFGFVVTGSQVTRLEFNVSYSDISCLGALSFGTTGLFASISNAEFSAASSSPSGDLTWSIAGTFNSATTATGTLQATITRVNPSVSACSTSVNVGWTAQKGS